MELTAAFVLCKFAAPQTAPVLSLCDLTIAFWLATRGLVMLRESLPDIIISDLKMPGMSFRRAQAILQGEELFMKIAELIKASPPRAHAAKSDYAPVWFSDRYYLLACTDACGHFQCHQKPCRTMKYVKPSASSVVRLFAT
jgi:hypothetical protein